MTSDDGDIWIVVADENDRRERQLLRQRERDWTMLGVAVAVILATCLLTTFRTGRVGFSGLRGSPLPELCGSRLMFGVDCPGCGLTRSFLALKQGDWQRSLAYNRVGWLFAVAILLQLPYRLYWLFGRPGDLRDSTIPTWCGRLLIVALIGNWLLGYVLP